MSYTENLKKLKQALISEPKIDGAEIKNAVEVLPITHNKDCIILQFCGWAIWLKEDGTY